MADTADLLAAFEGEAKGVVYLWLSRLPANQLQHTDPRSPPPDYLSPLSLSRRLPSGVCSFSDLRGRNFGQVSGAATEAEAEAEGDSKECQSDDNNLMEITTHL